MNKPFTIKLSEEHRAKLEAHRKAFGLRSEADAVRHLIDNSDPWDQAHGYIEKAGELQLASIRGHVDQRGQALERATKAYDGKGGADLQIGPVTPKPGSRLKKR